MPSAKGIISHVTKGDVLLDLGLSPEEAASLRARGELLVQIQEAVKSRKLKQRELAKILGAHQPDVSNLLGGRVTKFSLDRLVEFASRLGMKVQVMIEMPSAPRKAVAKKSRQRAA